MRIVCGDNDSVEIDPRERFAWKQKQTFAAEENTCAALLSSAPLFALLGGPRAVALVTVRRPN